MTSAWRIVKAKHAATAFDGEGARLFGGRWNSPGTPLVYLAESRSLALLEVLVHLAGEAVLASYVRFSVEFEDQQCLELDPNLLPEDWRGSPALVALQHIGDEWAKEGRSLLLAVPSAIVPEERLYLLNPRHPELGRVEIGEPEPTHMDVRLG